MRETNRWVTWGLVILATVIVTVSMLNSNADSIRRRVIRFQENTLIRLALQTGKTGAKSAAEIVSNANLLQHDDQFQKQFLSIKKVNRIGLCYRFIGIQTSGAFANGAHLMDQEQAMKVADKLGNPVYRQMVLSNGGSAIYRTFNSEGNETEITATLAPVGTNGLQLVFEFADRGF